MTDLAGVVDRPALGALRRLHRADPDAFERRYPAAFAELCARRDVLDPRCARRLGNVADRIDVFLGDVKGHRDAA